MARPRNTDKVGPPPATAYRELTVAGIVLGIVQGVILNLAFVYVALKLGFSICGSAVAAIMGYALLTGVMRRGTSLENNINQTIASGINTVGTGVVFTLPALFLLNAQRKAQTGTGLDFSITPILIGGVAGAILGTVFIIPLRKQMIELDRLRFPSGVAVTTIIRSGRAGIDKAKLLAYGFIVSMVWKLLLLSGWLDRPGVLEEEELHFGFGVIPDYLCPVVYLSLMNMAAGMLAGRGGLPFFVGGMLSWWVISPVAVNMGWTPADATGPALQKFIDANMLGPLGIGTLIGGALMGVVVCFPAIASALRSLAGATKTAGLGGATGGSDEMPLRFILLGTALGVSLFFTGAILTDGVGVTQAVVGTVIGTLWLGVAGLIVAQATGMTDMSPMSGMALISVTLMMFLYSGNVAAAMVVGVAVCVAIGQAADMMQDYKTGFMLGAKPIKQQIVQFACAWTGVLLAVGAIYALWSNGPGGQGGFGEGTALPAPQATVLVGVIEAVGSGDVPVDKYVMGGTIGALFGRRADAGPGRADRAGHVPAVLDHSGLRPRLPRRDGRATRQGRRLLRA